MPQDPRGGVLARDLRTMSSQLSNRRTMLRWLVGASLIPVVGCGSEGSGSSGDGSCDPIPEETAGPYPGDGSNGKNALVLSGIVRSDITSSIGTASAVAAGVPLTIEITLVGASGTCESLAGYAIYLWHCDRDGQYSMYSSSISGENYLRGVQETDSEGKVTFKSIFPGCYSGRWPHIHFEVYPSTAEATESGNKLATSQMALPEATCEEVYASAGYSASVKNLASTSLGSDNVFGDDEAESQLATMSGDASSGYTAKLTVAISV